MNHDYIDRPPKNRRKRGDTFSGDEGLETAFLATERTNKALRLPLCLFHCTPAKGRLHRRGFKVRHRVLEDRQTVAAWVE